MGVMREMRKINESEIVIATKLFLKYHILCEDTVLKCKCMNAGMCFHREAVGSRTI